jgi:hypothetical protein
VTAAEDVSPLAVRIGTAIARAFFAKHGGTTAQLPEDTLAALLALAAQQGIVRDVPKF